MALEYDISENLKEIIKKLVKRDPQRSEILWKKIRQIVASDEFVIEHYKNLRHNQSDLKRVHIDKSFVLTFKYYKDKKVILFEDFDHHDNIYRK
ncbi:MAG TPA: addiction module toxin RelE [archaeon]|nr:addiction module toxin RelE [archaeon]